MFVLLHIIYVVLFFSRFFSNYSFTLVGGKQKGSTILRDYCKIKGNAELL